MEEVTVQLADGWHDARGSGRSLVLRSARVKDEVAAIEDFRVYLRPECLPTILLSRVVSLPGERRRVGVDFLERLSARDLDALIDAYEIANGYADRDEDSTDP